MNQGMQADRNFAGDTAGATIVEYALLAALVTIGCVLVVGQMGVNVGAVYDAICQAAAAAVPDAVACS